MMQFKNRTTWNTRSLAALSRSLRKVFRPLWGILMAVWMAVLVLVVVAIIILELRVGLFNLFSALALAAAAVLAVLVGKNLDLISGWAAARSVLPDQRVVDAEFRERDYALSTRETRTRCRYEDIQALCDEGAYFCLLLDDSHGQVYAKDGFTEGTAQEFAAFIAEKTGKALISDSTPRKAAGTSRRFRLPQQDDTKQNDSKER